MTAIPLGAGLEITEDKLRVPAGTLSDCENYEIAYHSGYRRIDGFKRFDGRPELEDLAAYRALVKEIPGGPAYGLHFFADRARNISSLYGIVEAERVEVTGRAISPELLNTPGQRAEIYLGGLRTGIPNTWILEPNASFAGEPRELIEVLTTTEASIGFISAYTRVEVRSGQNVPTAGQQITDGTWLATVRGVEIISGTAVTGDLRMILWVENDTQDFVPVDSELVLQGTTDRVGYLVDMSGYSSNGNIVGSIEGVATDLDASVNKGVIVRSTERGWQPIDQSYEAAFNAGTKEPANVYLGGLQVSATETPQPLEPVVASTAAFVPNPTKIDWDLNNAALAAAIDADDGTFTDAIFPTVGTVTERIELSGFGLAIDELDEVTGMAVEVVAEKPVGTWVVRTDFIASSSPNHNSIRGSGTEIVTAKGTYTFGSANDLWGAANGEALKQGLNSSQFKVFVSFRCDDGADLPATIRLHAVRVIVYLREGSLASRVYIRSGGTDYEARVLFYSVSDGKWETAAGDPPVTSGGDAEGTMTFGQIDNPALIAANSEVRTAPGGGGDLIARLKEPLSPIRLPSKSRMDERQSRFQFITTNFFAAGRLTAVYGVSGAGPAFTFNNNYLFNIRTGRTEDEPRHVARHSDLLALGYDNGDADFSVPGRPDLFDGLLGAFTTGFGRRITGMLPLAGEALGVWTEDSTHIVKGATSDQVQQQVIAPTTGAIEYTVADMGIPIFCDFRGLNTLQASQSYGDFDLGRLSGSIRAWLLPRIQSQAQRPILAQPVRKKNQYRLYFADGQILTMTWLEDRVPRFSFQKWSIGEQTATVLAVTGGVDINAESLTFGSFNQSSFAYKLDDGPDFDGTAINAFFTINPLHVKTPSMKKRINVGNIHGIAEGSFSIQTTMAVDYGNPSPQINLARMSGNPAFAKFRHKARGRDFSLTVRTEGAPEHTIQVLDFPDLSLRNLER